MQGIDCHTGKNPSAARLSSRRRSSHTLAWSLACDDPPPDIARPPSAPTHPAQKIERTDETASAAVSSSPHSFSLPVHQRFRLISRPPGHKGCFRRTFLFAFLRFRFPKNVRNQFATTATKPPPNAVQPRGMRRMGSEAKWSSLTPIRKISERRQHREGQIQPSPRIDGIGIGIGKIHGSSTIINRQTR